MKFKAKDGKLCLAREISTLICRWAHKLGLVEERWRKT